MLDCSDESKISRSCCRLAFDLAYFAQSGSDGITNACHCAEIGSSFAGSPKGSYRLEKGPNEYSAWVVSTKDPKQRQLLSLAHDDYIDPDSCGASPDEKWLVMREELYQRAGPVKFVVFRKKGWFKTKFYQFVDNTIHPSSRHWIWSLGEWSADSGRLTIGLTWPDSDDVNIFFNTRTNEFEKN